MESELVTIAVLVFLPQYPLVIPAARATAKNKYPIIFSECSQFPLDYIPKERKNQWLFQLILWTKSLKLFLEFLKGWGE
jgi:hypothetical protein